MLLAGAFTGAVVGSIAANPWIGIVGAALIGGALAWVLAVLAIRYFVDQIIAGTVINIFAVGITSFLSARVLQTNPDLNNPPRLLPFPIPILSDIPIIGPILFTHNVVRVRDVRPRDRHQHRPVPDALGPPGPGGGRASEGGRHGRHQRAPDRATRT